MTLTIDHAVTTRQDSGAMTDLTPPDPEVRDRSSGRRRFSAKYKTRILAEYEALDRSERGAPVSYTHLDVYKRQERVDPQRIGYPTIVDPHEDSSVVHLQPGAQAATTSISRAQAGVAQTPREQDCALVEPNAPGHRERKRQRSRSRRALGDIKPLL